MSALPTEWLVETLLASTLLTIVVLVLRHPTARVFGPRVTYLLWVLPAIRMILPPLPQAQFADIPVGAGLAAVDQIALSMNVAEAQLAVLAVAPFDWLGTILAVWATGAVAHFLWHLMAYYRFLAATGAKAIALYTLSGITVHGASVSGPAATGIVRRRVLLPHDFTARFEAREQHLALAHELAHHKRGDLIANWIALVVLSAHWFNPVAHMAYRAFRADQELACDATVLATRSIDALHPYASAIVKATWDRGIVAACPLNHAGQLKRRLKMMRLEKKTLVQTASGLAVTLAVMGGCLVATASASAAAPVVNRAIEALTSNASTLSASPPPSSATQTPSATTGEDLAEPVAAMAEQALDLTAVQSDAAPVLEVASSTPANPVRTIGYRTAGSSPRQYVAPASKALFLSLLEGRGPDAEAIRVQNIILHGLSQEEVLLLTDVSRRAGNVREAAEAMSRLEPEIFEAPAAGVQGFVVDVSWNPRAGQPSGAEVVALLSEDSVKAAAVKARKEFESTPPGSSVRGVYATVVPGAFNGAAPGKPYVGFCGEIKRARTALRGGGARDWEPFFVSATPSAVNGFARRLFVGDSRVAERCGGERSAQAYTAYFVGSGPSYPSAARAPFPPTPAIELHPVFASAQP